MTFWGRKSSIAARVGYLALLEMVPPAGRIPKSCFAPDVVGELCRGVGLGEAVGAFRQHGGVPGLPFFQHLVGFKGIAVPEIGAFTWVGDDVEQEAVSPDLQVLVVAVAHGSLGVGPIAPE